MSQSPAGSATGIDLNKLLNQAETTANLGSEKHCRDLLLEIAATFAACRATPQHSVAEQSGELAIGVSNNDQGVHINIMQRHADGKVTVLHAAKAPAGDSFARVAFAQPLASTAATQPEQASIGNDEAFKLLLGQYYTSDEDTEAMAVEREIFTYIDSRAALAIPASTVPTQQANGGRDE